MLPAPAPLPDKFASLRGQTLSGELPDVLAALGDGPTDSGTPTEQPRAFLLTREQTERLVKAARAVIALSELVIFIKGFRCYFGDCPEYLDLKAALDGINIDL